MEFVYKTLSKPDIVLEFAGRRAANVLTSHGIGPGSSSGIYVTQIN
jgi:hypothetical protein